MGLKWKGTASDGTEVEGKVTIPEVSHENAIDGLTDYTVCYVLIFCAYLMLIHCSMNGRSPPRRVLLSMLCSNWQNPDYLLLLRPSSLNSLAQSSIPMARI